jgi:hypothetical protein
MRTSCALAVCWLVAMALPSTGQNLLTNAGFEAGTNDVNYNWPDSGWTGWDAQRENWFARQGTNCAVIEQWKTNDAQSAGHVYGGFGQGVAATSTGVYTFAIWILQSTNVNPNQYVLELGLDFTDGVGVTNSVKRDISSMPRDGIWHPVYVTGTNNNSTLTNIGVAVSCDWTNNGTQTMISGDDAELYAGPYCGATNLANANLEQPPNMWMGWGGSAWCTLPAMDQGYNGAQRWTYGWGHHSGSASFGLFSFTNLWWYPNVRLPPGEYAMKLVQTLTPGTGTYAFSIWMVQDAGFELSNAELRIEWYDRTFTNKVQSDTVASLSSPLSSSWQQYAVTGSCYNASLFEVRVSLYAQWRVSAATPGSPTLFIDDAGFARLADVPQVTDGIPNSWWQQYFSGPLTNRADADNDEDLFSNHDEYVADTNPTNSGAFFPKATNVGGRGVCMFTIAPTSTGRVYDVYWRTNLVPESQPWLPYGLSVTGNGGVITLTATNSGEECFYRTGVKLP